jgi:DNA polymerase-3 subunit beta
MKFNVKKEEMQEKLSNIQNIIEKKNTMPILSHFLLSAGKMGSYIVATDIETALKEPIDINVEKEGRICIPAKKLHEIVREIDTDLSFETIDEQWLNVKAGSSEFMLATLPHIDFPSWPAVFEGEDIEEVLITPGLLLELIEKTLYAAGENDTRYTLNGLLFHIKPDEKNISIVGTDGHRLAFIQKQVDDDKLSIKVKEEKRLIIPRKAVSELRRFLSVPEDQDETLKVRISLGAKHILFNINSIDFLSRLVDGTYPNYDNVIPKENEKRLIVKRDIFIKVLRRVSIMSRERASAVRFDVDSDRMSVSSSSPDIGEAKEDMEVEYNGEKMTLGFNAKYLLDVASAMNREKILLELQDPLSPVLLKEEGSEDYKCVVMPMRI